MNVPSLLSGALERPGVRLAALVALALIQIAVPLTTIAGRELTLRDGRVFRFETAPVDPVDVLRGRYVALAFTERNAPVAAETEIERGQRVFAPLEVGDNGFARLGPVTGRRPRSGDWIELQALSSSSGSAGEIAVRLPFDRFYMEEDKAPAADIAVWRVRQDRELEPSHAVVRVRRGQAVLEDVIVGGMPIREAAEAVLAEEPPPVD